MTEIPDDVVLPCGCIIRCPIIDGEKIMAMIPCHMSCPNLLNAVDLAQETGKDVRYKPAL